ncbi:MAG: phosphoribosylanthranilate isomerase [Planctomycetes bacterium]|nr:phosphoribosylanthranilate isomerase [Planctomycetota bacterium]
MKPAFVKICGVRDVETALVAADAGATAIGFVFARSPRRVSIADAREIAEQLPQSIERIGVFKNPTLHELEQAVAEIGLDAVQIHGNGLDLPATSSDAKIIPALHPNELTAAVIKSFGNRRFVVDASEGRGRASNLDALRDVIGGSRAIIAGGLTPDNVARVIAEFQPYGVDVSSGVESAPGVKDHQLIRKFCESCLKEHTHVHERV